MKRFVGIAIGMSAALFSFEASAHACNKGVKRAHCYCVSKVGSTEINRTINHGQCYNQQVNLALSGACANYCRGLPTSTANGTRALLIQKGLCGPRNVVLRYSAGTNPYITYRTHSLTAC
ncbi:MAG: hypothetical protein Q7V40_14720 [Pseudolabrys sp.]|nr:hypothetical protein [Pseudolabrys sp.]